MASVDARNFTGPNAIPETTASNAVKARLETDRRGVQFSLRRLFIWMTIAGALSGATTYVRNTFIKPQANASAKEMDRLKMRALDPLFYDGEDFMTTPTSDWSGVTRIREGISNPEEDDQVRKSQIMVVLARATIQKNNYTEDTYPNSTDKYFSELKGLERLSSGRAAPQSDAQFFAKIVNELEEIVKANPDKPELVQRCQDLIAQIATPEARAKNFAEDIKKWFGAATTNNPLSDGPMLRKMTGNMEEWRKINPQATYASAGVDTAALESHCKQLIQISEKHLKDKELFLEFPLHRENIALCTSILADLKTQAQNQKNEDSIAQKP